MPSPIRISVSEVRREIYRASGFEAGDGEPSTNLLGTIFHQVFESLMDSKSDARWDSVLDPETLSDHERLLAHAFGQVVGPKLRENQAALQERAAQVLSMWEATGHLCKYICQLLTNSGEQGFLRYDPGRNEWIGAEQFSMEEELTWLVEESGWSAPVVVTGVADGVWRNPASKRWCVVEMKLGAGSSSADIAQLCLYHEMLRAKAPEEASSISLLHFQPELNRQSFPAVEIEKARPHLLALIGRVAGVAGEGFARTASPAHLELGSRLVKVLEQFGPLVTLESDPVVGPAFLRFHITPGPGVAMRRILPLGPDVAVQLRLSRPAMISVEDGTLVVDLQRPDREKLLFKAYRDQLPKNALGNAEMLVGMDLNRTLRFADLSSGCPHILAAGTTGSGKSEWLKTALASLLATNTPETLRVILIDPKRVTFGQARKSRFLLYPKAMLFSAEEAITCFELLIETMEKRYQLFAEHRCNDIDALRSAQPNLHLPRIVLFCDEYGNLVAKRKDREAIELAIQQIAAKARAAGIHLVIATQDPRAQILSPALKTNLDARVCLRTASNTQSRMMLEQNGAESLLGYGDLLFRKVGQTVRLQALLLQDEDSADLFGE